MLGINTKISSYPAQFRQRIKPNVNKIYQNHLSFTANKKIINSKYDNVDFSTSKAADEIIEKYNNFQDVEVCTGRTQYYDTKDAQLFRLLRIELEAGNRELVNTVLNRLDLIGPVGYLKDTYAQVPIPYFEKNKSQKSLDYEPVDVFESFIGIGRNRYSKVDDSQKSYFQQKVDAFKEKKKNYEKLLGYKYELRIFAADFVNSQEGKNTLLPNCIVFIENDREMVYESVNWLGKILSDADIGFIEGRYSNLDEYRDKFQQELLNAKEKFEKTNKRSILFVPHLDDLADTRKNTSEDIAQMKYLLQAADREFHTTVVYYINPEKIPHIDKGVLSSNRAGMVLGD